MSWEVRGLDNRTVITDIDYSCENVIYEFTKNKTFVVNQDHEQMKEGIHEYEGDYLYWNIKGIIRINFKMPGINDYFWLAKFSNDGAELEIATWSSEGPKLQLVRIQ